MILEAVKNFLTPKKEDTPQSEVPKEKVLNDFDGDVYSTGAFFDDDFSSVFSAKDKANALEAQKSKIMLYRNIAKTC